MLVLWRKNGPANKSKRAKNVSFLPPYSLCRLSSAVHSATKEPNEFSHLFKQKSVEYVWEWNSRGWDNGARNIKLGQAELIDMGSLGGEFMSNMEDHTVLKNVKS